MKRKNILVSTILIFLMIVFAGVCIIQFRQDKRTYYGSVAMEEYRQQRLLDFCLQTAIDDEISLRTSLPETQATIIIKPYTDTTAYVVKNVRTMDTTFNVRIHKDNYRAFVEIQQYILKGYSPVNLGKVEHFLKHCLQYNALRTDSIYLEYIDLRNSKVLNSKGRKPIFYLESKTLHLDILKSVGVKASIEYKPMTFWEKKKITISLTVICVTAIFITLVVIFIYRKIIFALH